MRIRGEACAEVGAVTRVGAALLCCGVAVLAACHTDGPARTYRDPQAMARAAWGPADISACGKTDDGATLDDAHFVDCKTRTDGVRFIVAADEDTATARATDAQGMGLVAMRSGSWVVASYDPNLVVRVVRTLEQPVTGNAATASRP